jgi:hypothetical protein
MGGTTFQCTAHGKDVAEAFNAAREQALYDYGHAGYTGTIAEKHDWVMCAEQPLPAVEAYNLANQLIDASDPRVDDKWGPCGAIQLAEGGWVFFGWASC